MKSDDRDSQPTVDAKPLVVAPKERPILFSGPMVRALLDGRKTQTRRTVKPQPVPSDSNPPIGATPGGLYVCPDYLPTSDLRGSVIVHCEAVGQYRCMGQQAFAAAFCPYGVPGDRLWVREGHAPAADCWGRWEQSVERKRNLFAPGELLYRVDAADQFVDRWRPGIHMPRWASRITLEITEVRVQRLQEIGEEDAAAEGFPSYTATGNGQSCQPVGAAYVDGREWYARLWDSINGAGAWHANPWVWALTFRRIS
jgi:hypothetical protein